MKTYVQPGNTITLTAPYAVASGDGLLVGSIFGVAAGAANGACFAFLGNGAGVWAQAWDFIAAGQQGAQRTQGQQGGAEGVVDLRHLGTIIGNGEEMLSAFSAAMQIVVKTGACAYAVSIECYTKRAP